MLGMGYSGLFDQYQITMLRMNSSGVRDVNTWQKGLKYPGNFVENNEFE